MFEEITIPTYIINLKDRSERLLHIRKQFENKSEFELHIVEAFQHTIGAVGLWKSICEIINKVIDTDEDVIIICEDDHEFTQYYDREYMINNIIEGAEQGVELLSGGIGGFGNAVPLSTHRYWIDSFWCTQFIILYRPIFKKILDVEFNDNDTADGIFSELTSHKMVLYPFISIQKDFGYSDVTKQNNEISGMITSHFDSAISRMKNYQTIQKKFLSEKNVFTKLIL